MTREPDATDGVVLLARTGPAQSTLVVRPAAIEVDPSDVWILSALGALATADLVQRVKTLADMRIASAVCAERERVLRIVQSERAGTFESDETARLCCDRIEDRVRRGSAT